MVARSFIQHEHMYSTSAEAWVSIKSAVPLPPRSSARTEANVVLGLIRNAMTSNAAPRK